MQKAVSIARTSILYITTLVLVAGYPATVMATSQEPATNPPVTVVQEPEANQSESEEQPLTYTFDPVAKKWNSEQWYFNPESGAYEKPPTPVIIEPESPVIAPVESSIGTSGDTKEIATDTSQKKTVNTEVDVETILNSDALSGNAKVIGNTLAGNAMTGDASAVANILNAVNSSVGSDKNQKVTTFSKDVIGDVKGDIILYPMLLKAMLEQEAQKTGATKINATSDLNINNDLALKAKSGTATVDSNTKAGDATTGNATAMANVINILNSMIAMQDSFIGTINIYGSLEGDILIAPDFIPQMLANNGAGGGSNAQLSSQDTTTIVNNINAVAKSGAASVFGNTSAGSATSGSADTGVVIFNVTGRDIVAENSMLVFVNVLGKWVGMIIDAPGANAAMIGSGVVSDSTAKHNYPPDLQLQARSKHGITNTIALAAETGDATVSNNTTAGNATTGNARAFANVANVSNSSLSLTGWFGLLFINITGDWYGSFQIDTPFGNPPARQTVPEPSGPVQFVPTNSAQPKARSVRANSRATVIDSRSVAIAPVQLASSETEKEESEAPSETEVNGTSTENGWTNDEVQDETSYLFWIILGSITVAGSAVIGVRRFF